MRLVGLEFKRRIEQTILDGRRRRRFAPCHFLHHGFVVFHREEGDRYKLFPSYLRDNCAKRGIERRFALLEADAVGKEQLDYFPAPPLVWLQHGLI
jgi:hypothetical protein